MAANETSATLAWSIVVGGGSGQRFGYPKQFAVLDESSGARVIDRAVEVALASTGGVVLVVPPDAVDAERQLWANRSTDVDVVGGGNSRSASVRNGLTHVPAAAEVVVVHDAARPLATPQLFERVIAAVADGADGAVPGIPVVDTIKVVDEHSNVVASPDRDRLVAVQTPQAFRRHALVEAHADGLDGSDDAVLIELTGGRVVVVEGEQANIKVTHPADLATVAEQLQARSS